MYKNISIFIDPHLDVFIDNDTHYLRICGHDFIAVFDISQDPNRDVLHTMFEKIKAKSKEIESEPVRRQSKRMRTSNSAVLPISPELELQYIINNKVFDEYKDKYGQFRMQAHQFLQSSVNQEAFSVFKIDDIVKANVTSKFTEIIFQDTSKKLILTKSGSFMLSRPGIADVTSYTVFELSIPLKSNPAVKVPTFDDPEVMINGYIDCGNHIKSKILVEKEADQPFTTLKFSNGSLTYSYNEGFQLKEVVVNEAVYSIRYNSKGYELLKRESSDLLIMTQNKHDTSLQLTDIIKYSFNEDIGGVKLIDCFIPQIKYHEFNDLERYSVMHNLLSKTLEINFRDTDKQIILNDICSTSKRFPIDLLYDDDSKFLKLDHVLVLFLDFLIDHKEIEFQDVSKKLQERIRQLSVSATFTQNGISIKEKRAPTSLSAGSIRSRQTRSHDGPPILSFVSDSLFRRKGAKISENSMDVSIAQEQEQDVGGVLMDSAPQIAQRDASSPPSIIANSPFGNINEICSLRSDDPIVQERGSNADGVMAGVTQIDQNGGGFELSVDEPKQTQPPDYLEGLKEFMLEKDRSCL